MGYDLTLFLYLKKMENETRKIILNLTIEEECYLASILQGNIDESIEETKTNGEEVEWDADGEHIIKQANYDLVMEATSSLSHNSLKKIKNKLIKVGLMEE